MGEQASPGGSGRLDEAGVPRLPRTYVARKDLWRRLDAAGDAAVVTLVAPAGAGKTLGAAGWLRRGRARAAAGDVVWLDAGHGLDVTAIDEALQGAAPTPGQEPRLVVVDDAHVLSSSAVRLLDARLNDAPESMRVLLLSRWDLPLTRLAPQLLGHLTELRGDVLRLSPEESSELISLHVGSAVPDVVSAIADRAEGWCAVAVLASRLVATSPDQAGAVRRMAQGSSTVADQVVNEVFSTLTSRERHLLLCTASEREVSVRTAMHLSQDRGAGLVLDGLESTGLLVTRSERGPHPGTPGSANADGARFRIHPLLVEVVRRRISAGGVDVELARSTVRRAVELDARRGAVDDAFRRLVDLGLAEAAAAQLVEEGTRLLTRGHGKDVVAFAQRWPECVDAHPESWFVLAVERWARGDVTSAMHWIDRLSARSVEVRATPRLTAQLLCARLMRARAGFEPLAPVVEEAQRHVESAAFAGTPSDLQPHVLSELGIAQLALGALVPAEADLLRAARLGEELDMPAHAAAALAHLAGLYYMRGRELVARRLADRSVEALEHLAPEFPVPRHRAELFGRLARMSTLPPPAAPGPSASGDLTPTGKALHPADATTRFWQHVHDARVHLSQGSVVRAEQTLQAIMDVPGLPHHLRTAVLVERAFLAALRDDRPTLSALREELHGAGATGEALLIHGIEADLVGELRPAVGHFAAAAGHRMLDQPPCRALALVCRAQLLHALGDGESARDAVLVAVRETESRGNYVPFLGWTRHGSPVHVLLSELEGADPAPWLGALLDLTRESSDITSALAPSTATRRERPAASDPLVTADLSPRERDVLRELARGATYADIAEGLFVSQNTVKTHVSSLYNKLGARRRSEALSLARRLQLL